MDHGGILDPSLGHEGGVRLDLVWARLAQWAMDWLNGSWRLMALDIGGPFRHCMGQGRILDPYWVLKVESVWTWFGLGRLSGSWTGLMDHGG